MADKFGWLKRKLQHPLMSGRSLDDPQTTILRRQVIEQNKLLKRIYSDWYQLILSSMPIVPGKVLELGSGAGFIRQYLPDVITSEIIKLPLVDVVLDAQLMPICSSSLRAVIMEDVLHHIPHPRRFFAELARVLVDGGRCIMIEPWVTLSSKLIYTKLHHEGFDATSPEWDFPTGGPVSEANLANPWKIFHKDRALFESDFPQLKIQQIQPISPFLYLLSGGVSSRNLFPEWMNPLLLGMERMAAPIYPATAMFALIVLEKQYASN